MGARLAGADVSGKNPAHPVINTVGDEKQSGTEILIISCSVCDGYHTGTSVRKNPILRLDSGTEHITESRRYTSQAQETSQESKSMNMYDFPRVMQKSSRARPFSISTGNRATSAVGLAKFQART